MFLYLFIFVPLKDLRAFALLLYILHRRFRGTSFEEVNSFAFLKSKVSTDAELLRTIASSSVPVANLIENVCYGKQVSANAFARLLDEVVRSLPQDDGGKLNGSVLSL